MEGYFVIDSMYNRKFIVKKISFSRLKNNVKISCDHTAKKIPRCQLHLICWSNQIYRVSSPRCWSLG